MAYEQIAEYVRMCLGKGYSKESIKQAVAARGYDPAIVDQIESLAYAEAHRTTPKPLVHEKKALLDKMLDRLRFMTYERMVLYVRECLSKGYSKESIKHVVASRGYDPAIVDKIESQMYAVAHPAKNPLVYKATPLDKVVQNPRIIIEIIVLIVVVLAAIDVYYWNTIMPYLLLQFQLLLNLVNP